jgi:hypothetical protein
MPISAPIAIDHGQPPDTPLLHLLERAFQRFALSSRCRIRAHDVAHQQLLETAGIRRDGTNDDVAIGGDADGNASILLRLDDHKIAGVSRPQ